MDQVHKTFKRWKPCLATELDRYLGEGSVRDRMLIVELLEVDDAREMCDVLNLYRIPMHTFDLSLGTRYDPARDGEPRALDTSAAQWWQAYLGQTVLFPSVWLPEELKEEEGDEDAAMPDGLLLRARLERIRSSGEAVIAVTGDDETFLIEPSVLRRPPTAEEALIDARAQADEAEKRRLEAADASGDGPDHVRGDSEDARAFATGAAEASLPAVPARPPPPPGTDEENDPELARAIAESLALMTDPPEAQVEAQVE